jgi:hypothetical protein
MAFSIQVFPQVINEYIPVLVGALNLVAGTLTSVSAYEKTAEHLEGHRLSAVQFSKLRRKILEKLETKDISEAFVSAIREDLDSLIEQGPVILNCIIIDFKREHANLKTDLPALVQLGGYDHNVSGERDHTIEIHATPKLHTIQEEKRSL